MYFRVVLLSFYIKCVFSFVLFFFFFVSWLFYVTILHHDIQVVILIMLLYDLYTYIFCTQLISVCYGKKINHSLLPSCVSQHQH